MAYHFSAEQFDKAFLPKRLGNWEVPHRYSRCRPRAPAETHGGRPRPHVTVPIADEHGRLLAPPDTAQRPHCWGLRRRTAWDYPRRITRQIADELSQEHHFDRYPSCKGRDKSKSERVADDADAEPPQGEILSNEKPEEFKTELEENIDALNLQGIENIQREDPRDDMERDNRESHDKLGKIVDPFSGYYYARKMHMDNLLHRPLPDALGIKESNLRHVPGRDLMVKPYSEPQNVSLLVHGSQRPLTSIGNKLILTGTDKLRLRPATCDGLKLLNKGVTPMDLAICWDYRTLDPKDEPKRPKHIDGSNGSRAPAVFSMVHSPKIDHAFVPDTGRSNAIFSQNIVYNDGDDNRILPTFDKDMSKNRRKDACETPKCPQHSYYDRNNGNELVYKEKKHANRNGETKETEKKKVPCDGIHGCGTPPDSESVTSKTKKNGNSKEENAINRSKENHVTNKSNIYRLKERRKSLDELNNNHNSNNTKEHRSMADKSNFYQSSPNLSKNLNELSKYKNKNLNRSCTACNCNKGVENEPPTTKAEYKMAFKAGKPNSISGSEGKSGESSSNSTKVSIRVPKMKDPYRKKSYSIPTLAPPFSRWQDASGYPEHWRLASMYQHAYKTPDSKRRPLLPAVYQ